VEAEWERAYTEASRLQAADFTSRHERAGYSQQHQHPESDFAWVLDKNRAAPSGLRISPSYMEHGIGAPTTTLMGFCSGSRPLPMPRNRPRP